MTIVCSSSTLAQKLLSKYFARYTQASICVLYDHYTYTVRRIRKDSCILVTLGLHTGGTMISGGWRIQVKTAPMISWASLYTEL